MVETCPSAVQCIEFVLHTYIQVYAACVCIESTLNVSPSVSYTLTPQSMHISLAQDTTRLDRTIQHWSVLHCNTAQTRPLPPPPTPTHSHISQELLARLEYIIC